MAQIYSDDELDDDNLDEGEDEFLSGRDSVIFGISCCKEMFEPYAEEIETPFNRIIAAIHNMLLNKIITSNKDVQGVVLFGTNKSENSGNFPGVCVWQKLSVPSIKSITALRDLQDIQQEFFKSTYGLDSDYSTSDVLWECLNMFSAATYKLATKSLILFTWRSNPHLGDNTAARQARAKAGDLHDHGVDLQVYSFNRNFEYAPFYKQIVTNPEQVQQLADGGNPIQSILDLYSFLLRKCSKQRAGARIPLRFGKHHDFEIAVQVHTVARRTVKSAAIQIDRKTNQQVKKQTNVLDANTGDILMPSDIKQLQTWGGRDIVFEKEEVAAMKRFGDIGLSILGFKPKQQAVRRWHHVKAAQFIYPDEEKVKGSTSVFAALLKKCLEKDVAAIASYRPRQASAPRCVALIPQDEVVDEESYEQIKPPGFYLIFLPFADDLRNVEISRKVQMPNEQQVHAAEAIIKKLRFPYDPENFDNPALQTHYKALEAMALEKDKRDEIEDHTIPNTNRINAKAGQLIKTFKELVFPAGYDPNGKGTKRSASSSTSSSKKKKSAASSSAANNDDENVEIDIGEYVTQNKLNKLTVPGLKEICKAYQISAPTKKADLIAKISSHYYSLNPK